MGGCGSKAAELHQGDGLALLRNYELGGELGRGAFGFVRAATHKETGEEVAVKVIERARVKKRAQGIEIAAEIETLRKVTDPHIVKLVDVLEDKKFIVLIMEKLRGEDLWNYTVRKKSLSEHEAREAITCVLRALESLHSKRALHRDVKPENIMLAVPDDTKSAKLIDFGLSTAEENPDDRLRTTGTPGYIAPEVLQQQGQTSKADVFSAGVVLFILLTGEHPFSARDRDEIDERTIRGQFEFPREPQISTLSKNLIANMLAPNPKERFSATDALRHPWITGE